MLDASPSEALAARRPIPFSRAYSSRRGLEGISRAVATGALKAGGPATKRCEAALTDALGVDAVLMVSSCTAALELSAMLVDAGPGDEVIMPSYGFASAANAFVLRGATPVFVDIVPGTLTADPRQVAGAITDRTKAIMPVHYAGVGAGMREIRALAEEHGIAVIEDAAQGIGASVDGRALGTIGSLGAISFDATKNIQCGAGGALIVNDPALMERAEWLRDYGTDRAGFSRGDVERYRWVSAGTNAALNELSAAYLAPQLEEIERVTDARRTAWARYHDAFGEAESHGLLTRPIVPPNCYSNGHAYVIVLPTPDDRSEMISALAAEDIEASFHFVPLHSAPAGRVYGRAHGDLRNTDRLSASLVRLPLWQGITNAEIDRVIDAVSRQLDRARA